MAVNVKDLNYQLKNVNNQISFDEINSAASTLTDQFKAASHTQLGFGVGEIKGGIESLVQNIDYPLGETSSAIAAVSRVTANVPNVKSDLIQTISGTDATKLGSIVESTAASGLLDEIITAGTAEAIATAFKQVLGKTSSELENTLLSIAPIGLSVQISTSVDDVLSGAFKNPFAAGVGNIATALTAAVGGLNSTNLIKNVVENFTGQITNTVLSSINIPDSVITQLAVVAIMDGNVDLAVDKSIAFLPIPKDLTDLSIRVGVNIDKSSVNNLVRSLDILEQAGGSSSSIQIVINNISSIQSSFSGVSGGISNSVQTGNSALGSPSPDRIATIGGASSGGSGAYDTDFSYIESLEEMTADLRAVTRPVSTTIVHWTSHYIDDNHIDAQAIKQIHISKGLTTIGYHYIIKRDGSIQRGRNPNRVGAHAKSSHNPYSIGIGFVGGYNCPNGTSNPERCASADSINSAQWAAFDMYLKAFYTVYSGGEVWGHQDTDPWNKIDPMSNMTSYVKNKFGKTNVSPQPSRTYSLEELAEKLFGPVRTDPLDEGNYTGENGRLDINTLTVIAPGHRLRADAASAYLQMVSSASAAGIQWSITDSYRTYEAQVRLAQEKGIYGEGGYAARPGTSNHGWGLALDLGSRDRTHLEGTPEYNWLVANANSFGFKTILKSSSGPAEPWHWEYVV